MPCGWGVKAGMVCVWVAGKTVWSPCYTRVISEHFEVVHHDKALYKYQLLYLPYFTLAVTRSLTWVELRCKRWQSESYLDYGLWNRWPRRDGYSCFALQGVGRKLTIRVGASVSHAPCLPCHIDLTDTVSCSNRCVLTFYTVLTLSSVISRGPTMRVIVTGNVPLLEQKRR